MYKRQVPEHYVNRLEGRRFHHEDRKVFAAMVLALDDGIGRVMESLRKNGLEENTLFILISDNGSPRGQGIELSLIHILKSVSAISPTFPVGTFIRAGMRTTSSLSTALWTKSIVNTRTVR